MGIFQQFPYSNFHEFNLDQIIKIMLEMQDEWNTTKTEWTSYKEFIDNYFENLDVSEEVLDAMRIFAGDGTLNEVVDPTIIAATTAWLADHIAQPTTPAIDTSLSVAGAAADSKATGDAVKAINENTNVSANKEMFPEISFSGSSNGITVEYENKEFSIVGSAVANSSFRIIDRKLLEAGDYVIDFNCFDANFYPVGSGFDIRVLDDNNTMLARSNANPYFTLNADTIITMVAYVYINTAVNTTGTLSINKITHVNSNVEITDELNDNVNITAEKNIAPIENGVHTISGVTATVNDGEITLNGTAGANLVAFTTKPFKVGPGTYHITDSEEYELNKYVVRVLDSNNQIVGNSFSQPEFTLNAETLIKVIVYVYNNAAFTNVKFTPALYKDATNFNNKRLTSIIPKAKYYKQIIKKTGLAIDGRTYLAFSTGTLYKDMEIHMLRAAVNHYPTAGQYGYGEIWAFVRTWNGELARKVVDLPYALINSDFRDPQLSVIDNKLLLSLYTKDTSNNLRNFIFSLNDDLTVDEYIELPAAMVTWGKLLQTPDGYLLKTAYAGDSVYMLKSDQPFTGTLTGLTFSNVGTIYQDNALEPSETTIEYCNDKLIAMIRCNFGTTRVGYSDNLEGTGSWTISDTGHIMFSPVLVKCYSPEMLVFAVSYVTSGTSIRPPYIGLLDCKNMEITKLYNCDPDMTGYGAYPSLVPNQYGYGMLYYWERTTDVNTSVYFKDISSCVLFN